MKSGVATSLDVVCRWDEGNVQHVGRLAYRDSVAYFEFDSEFLTAGLELSPVHHKAEPGLHRPYRRDVFEGLHGVFNDSLPDGWGRLLVDRRARQLGIEPASLTPLDRLVCVGSTGIGTLCYHPEIDVWGSDVDRLDLDDLAADTRLVLRGDATEVLPVLGRVGGSPGGARPKALVALDEEMHVVHGAGETPAGYVAYLVKFRGPGDPADMANVEMAYAMMAEEAGVTVSEPRLLEGAGGFCYYASRRFDRDVTERFHVHTASGLLYADFRIPSLDYRDLILLTRFLTRDQRACRDMFILAAFNVLSHNRDDHARQFSFLMDRRGTWSLAPAYDLTFSPGPGGEHSTSVLGHGKDITRDQLLDLGRYADIGERDALAAIDRIRSAVSCWGSLAKNCGVSNASRTGIASALQNVGVS